MLTTLIITLSSCVGGATDIYANSTSPIQNAVNIANPGDVIIVEPGTYMENIIISKNNLVIRSESGNPANTIIAAKNSNASVITIQDANSVKIKGFNITGAGTAYSGIYVLRSPNCIIEDNILYNDALGVYLKTSDNTVVRNNTASKNLLIGTGVGLNIEQSNYTSASSNTISSYNVGIDILGSKSNSLSGNTISQSAVDGIIVENSINNILENNTAKSNARYGIYLSGSSNNSLRDNSVSNGTNVIYLVWSSGNTISGNKVDFGNQHDIMLDNSSDNGITNNIISSSPYGIAVRYSNNNNLISNNAYNNTQGFYITLTSRNNTLSKNKANSNTGSGISLYRVNDNILESNEANSNTNQGILLDNSSSNKVFNNTASQNFRGIYLSSLSSGNTISNNTVNSNSGSGITLDGAGNGNNLTSNVAGLNSVYGIYLVNSTNNNLINNKAPGNSKKGIYIISSTGNMVSGNTVSDNGEEGIMLLTSTSNILYRNKAVNNSYGISMSSSQSNNISGNSVTLSRTHGLFLCVQSINNNIFDNYLNNTFNVDNKNNGSIWYKTKTSGTNVVGGPYIGGNYWANPLGTGFSQTATDANEDGIADSSYIGDNLIDNFPLVAVYIPEPVLPVVNFNVNVTSGNAPLAVLFTDLSQNSTSRSWDINNDGVEDSNASSFVYVYTSPGTYTSKLTVSNANGTDSKTAVITVLEKQKILPVADFSTSVTSGSAPLSVLFTDLSQDATSRSWDFNNDGISDATDKSLVYVFTNEGTYTVNLTATNENGTASKQATITVSIAEEEHHSSSGSSSSGGGGGSPESSRNIDVKELSQVFITNGNPVKFDFTKKATCVVYVSFDAKKTAGKTTTIAEQLKGKSSLVSEMPSGEVFKSFNLWVGNSGFATSKNIENPVICFKVEKAWIQDKNIDQSSIVLNRYSNKTWEQLPASLSGEDEEYLYFTVATPGFSSFVITGKSNTSPEETVTEIRPVDESGNSEENMGNTGSEADPKPVQGESSTPGFEMVYGVAGLLAVFLYKRK